MNYNLGDTFKIKLSPDGVPCSVGDEIFDSIILVIYSVTGLLDEYCITSKRGNKLDIYDLRDYKTNNVYKVHNTIDSYLNKYTRWASGEHLDSYIYGSKTQTSNCKCITCGELNEYAIPNQSNGTFKCYQCRTLWHP